MDYLRMFSFFQFYCPRLLTKSDEIAEIAATKIIFALRKHNVRSRTNKPRYSKMKIFKGKNRNIVYKILWKRLLKSFKNIINAKLINIELIMIEH